MLVQNSWSKPCGLLLRKYVLEVMLENYYMPGEDCVAICEVDNFKCSLRMRVVVCEFVKVLTLTTNQGVEKKITQVINSISFPGIEAHGQYTQGDAQKLPLPLKYKNN
jgi:hypothetical protein